MSQIAWPTAPFYIVSLVGDQYHALTAFYMKLSDSVMVRASPLIPDATQLWMALEMPMGEDGVFAAVLWNMGYDRAICYGNKDGVINPALILSPNFFATRNGHGWRLEAAERAPRRILNTLADEEIKLTVTESTEIKGLAEALSYISPTSDTQLFYIVEETGSLFTNYGDKSIEELFPPGPNGRPAPISINENGGRIVVVTNSTDEEYIGQAELSYTKSSSSAFTSSTTNTVTHKLTTSLGVSGLFAKILTVDAKAEYSVENTTTVTLSTEKTQVNSETYTITCTTAVPRQRTYRFQVEAEASAYSSSYVIPVVLKSCIPGGASFELTLRGEYFGSNTHTSQIVITDVTSQKEEEHFVVSRIPIKLRH